MENSVSTTASAKALQYAKEITVAALEGNSRPTNSISGNEVADFFQTVFLKIEQIEKARNL